MDLEDAPLGLGVRKRELDLSVDSARSDQRRVQRLDPVSSHDDLEEHKGMQKQWDTRAANWVRRTRSLLEAFPATVGRAGDMQPGARAGRYVEGEAAGAPRPHLDVRQRIKPVQLVEQLEHGPLDLPLPPWSARGAKGRSESSMFPPLCICCSLLTATDAAVGSPKTHRGTGSGEGCGEA